MKKFSIFAIAMMLMVSCGLLPSKIKGDENTLAGTTTTEQPEGDVFSNGYDGFLNIRVAPNYKSKKIGEFKNGPKGANMIEYGAKWSKIEYQGVEGYVKTEYLQTTPTQPANVRPEAVVGSWYYRPEGWGHIAIIIEEKGIYHIYNDNFCEGAVVSVGTWSIVGDNIELNEQYDLAQNIGWGCYDCVEGKRGIKSNLKILNLIN